VRVFLLVIRKRFVSCSDIRRQVSIKMNHRVFVSSTYSDLATHRDEVQSAIRRLGASDVSMENFGSRDERPLDECVRVISDECDVFVGIYAHRYGFVPDGLSASICEAEFEAATGAKLKRFVYIVDENVPWLPANIDTGQNQRRLDEFKARLRKQLICSTFRDPNHLASGVAADLGRHFAMQAAKKVGPGIPVNHIGVSSIREPTIETSDAWNVRRNGVKTANRNVFLTHIIKPSTEPGQLFDVFLYLLRQDTEVFSDIAFAEFFFGKYWENKVFPAAEENGFIGISTSAYGPFLAICRVTFQDGGEVYLERYIDFEMRHVVE
jgi:hypothetical protein